MNRRVVYGEEGMDLNAMLMATVPGACQARPELLQGTCLTIQAWNPDAVAVGEAAPGE